MNFEQKIKNLIALQAVKIAMNFTIVDFTKMVIKAADEGKFICEEAAEEILKNLEEHYDEFILSMAEDEVFKLFNKHAEEIIKERESEEIEDLVEEIEDLEELEEIPVEPLEKEEGETDLQYVIRNDIYMKNANIYNQERFPEAETENYWMIGININELSEEELQSLSIFDRDFW